MGGDASETHIFSNQIKFNTYDTDERKRLD